MANASEIFLEYVCPLCGVILSVSVYVSPIQDAYEACRAGKLGPLNPTPWAVMLGNTLGWLTYSSVIQNLFVFLPNVPGILITCWLNMQALKLLYAAERTEGIGNSVVATLQSQSSELSVSSSASASSKSLRLSPICQEGPIPSQDEGQHSIEDSSTEGSDIELGKQGNIEEKCKEEETAVAERSDHDKVLLDFRLLEEMIKLVKDATKVATFEGNAPTATSHENLVMCFVLVWLTVIGILTMGSKALTQNSRELLAGLAVNLNLIFLYAAPLSTVYQVLQTQSSSTIHIPLVITNTLNGLFWGAYGLAVMDPFIFVPNGLGALLSMIQAILWAMFKGKK